MRQRRPEAVGCGPTAWAGSRGRAGAAPGPRRGRAPGPRAESARQVGAAWSAAPFQRRSAHTRKPINGLRVARSTMKRLSARRVNSFVYQLPPRRTASDGSS